jgi:PBSX family phage terminase large subunit
MSLGRSATVKYHPSVKLRAAAELELRRRRATPSAGPEWRGAALEAQGITAPEWIVAGPAETGKTFSTLWRLDALLQAYPGSNYALVRKVAADIGPTVLRTFQRVISLSQSGAQPYGGAHPQWYDYPNGARLWIGGMDRPGKVLSGERDGIYVNQAEELTLEDWETLSTRATGRGAVTDTPMLFGDCNPGPPSHWIINRSSLRVLYSKHEDNPTLYTAAGALTEQGKRSLAVLDNLTGVRYKRLRQGLWVAAEGTVYDFDRSVHLIEKMPRGWEDWPRYRSIDFGYTNPFVCQWWAQDGDGRLYLYREIYMSKRTVKVHAEQIRRLEKWHLPDGTDNPDRERVRLSLSDHDAEDRATLEENRIQTYPANKAISVGIQKVQERLKVAGDGRPRLFILRNSLVEQDDELVNARQPTCTEQEFEMYAWPKGQDGKPIKEDPVDMYNHGMDALRYCVVRFDGARGNSAVGAFGS